MEEIKEEKRWSLTSWSAFLEGVLLYLSSKKCCFVAKTAVCLFVSKAFCSNPLSVQRNKLFVFVFKNIFLKHKLLDGKEKKEPTCTLSGKACSKLMLDLNVSQKNK